VIEERKRSAQDLNDEPVQALIYLARRQEGMAVDPRSQLAPAVNVNQARKLAVAVVKSLRQLTMELRSEILQREGLAAALSDLSQRSSYPPSVRPVGPGSGTHSGSPDPGGPQQRRAPCAGQADHCGAPLGAGKANTPCCRRRSGVHDVRGPRRPARTRNAWDAGAGGAA
jgi:hypothetical protein